MPQNKSWALQAAEKLHFGQFCNKGTALAGPIKPIKSQGFSPCGMFFQTFHPNSDFFPQHL
jgi:hypothetical protein